MRADQGLALAALALAPAACSTFAPASEAVLARARAAAVEVPDARVETCEVTIRSDSLQGTFTALLASERAARVRLQLFPDIGGKILDLSASSERISGTIPQADVRYDHQVDGTDLPRHLLLFFAITLLERSTPLSPERVLGARARGETLELRLEPRVPGCDVVAEIDATGVMIARRYAYRHVSWREQIGPTARVSGKGFELEARVVQSSDLPAAEREVAFGGRP